MTGYATHWPTVHGWFDWEPLYRRIVDECTRPMTVVEMGVWQGKSAIYLANRIKESGKPITFFAVDTFQSSPETDAHLETLGGKTLLNVFLQNVNDCEVSDWIQVVAADSLDAARGFDPASLDVVYIDGAHDYDSVVADLAAWTPKVKPGGLIAGHDYNPGAWPGVVQAVTERFPVHRNPGSWWEADV